MIVCHFKDEKVFAVAPKLYCWDKETFNYGMHMGEFKDGYLIIDRSSFYKDYTGKHIPVEDNAKIDQLKPIKIQKIEIIKQ